MRKPFIIAEMSANHLGSLDRAMAIVEAAAKAGADAVKLQTWSTMVADRSYVIAEGPWAGRNLHELYEEAKTPWEWHPAIFDRCKALGMIGFSSVFDAEALAFLELLHCPIYKIASFELVDTPLIKRVAETGKPMILSTGMATLEEVADAVLASRTSQWHPDLTLLKCTSAYPSDEAEVGLGTMVDMGKRFGCDVGLSDHTLSPLPAVVAVRCGAAVIEKHLTLSRADGGPDAGFSSEPAEFAEMVRRARSVDDDYTAFPMPTVRYGPTEAENPQLALRRSLWWAHDGEAGAVAPRIISARPALGLPPRALDEVKDKTLARPVKAGTPVRQEDFV